MDCVKCGSSQVKVIDTRGRGRRRIYRRRVCLTCGARWTTVELPAGDLYGAVQRARSGLDELEGGRRGKKHFTG